MMNHDVVTLLCATPSTDTAISPRAKTDDKCRYVSRAFSNKSNCRRAARQHSEEEGLMLESYTYNELGNGKFTFEVHLPSPEPKPARKPVVVEEPAAPAIVPASNEQREEIARVAEALKRGKDPFVGMAPDCAEQHRRLAAGTLVMSAAKAKKAPTKGKAKGKAGGGERRAPDRYDWAGAAEKAEKGTVPPSPAFSADNCKPYQGKIDDLRALVKKGDLKRLKDFPIPAYNSIVRTMARWRDLCVKALVAKKA